MTTDYRAMRHCFGKAANRRKLGQRRLLEALEGRVLFATDYVLSGNTLTTYTNGVPGAPVVVPNVNNVQITGDAGVNHIFVENFAGAVTVSGQGGGDLITVTGGGGGTVTLSGTTVSDQLIVRSPTAVVANITVGASVINVGSDTINYGSSLAAVSVIGQLFTAGDTLTVNGTAGSDTVTMTGSTVAVSGRPLLYYSTFTQLTINGLGGNDAYTVTGSSLPSTILAGGAGDATFTVNANSVALALTGTTSGTSAFTVNSNSGPLTITGQGAANTFTVASSAAGITINGGSSTNVYSVTANSANLTINGGGTSNNVTIGANSGSITVNGGTGTDSFGVVTNSGSVALKGGAGATTTYDIAAPTIGPVSVQGNAIGSGALTFHGTTLSNVFAITSTTLSAGSGATMTYSNLTSVTVDGVAGNDTFLMTSSGTPTTLMGQSGNNTFNIRANTALTTINTGTGTNTINVGSNAPGVSGNILGNVVGGVDVVGSGTDTLNLNDQANAVAQVVELSTTGFTGIGGGITYAGLTALNVKMGSGGNTLNVTGTMTTTGVNLGAGVNSVMISSSAPATGGDVESVFGLLTLTGSGADALVVDDTGSVGVKTGQMTGGWIAGITPATIMYSGFASLVVGLGTGGTDFEVLGTLAATPVTINGGAGNDTIRIDANSSAMAVTTGGGADVVAVKWIGAATTVTSAGGSTIVVGSNAPAAGGVLANIQALLTVNGAGTDVLTLDDTGNTSAASGTLTATTVTGFGMGASGIAYSGIGTLGLAMGSGANELTIEDTAAGTVTSVDGNVSADTITVEDTGDVTNINTGDEADTVYVLATGAVLNVDVGTSAGVPGDLVRVSSVTSGGTGVVDGILGTVNVVATGGFAGLYIGDQTNAAAKTVTVDGGSVTGAAPAAINYTNLFGLVVALGLDADVVTVTDTGAVQTVVDTGWGNDTVNVTGTSSQLEVVTGTGDDVVELRASGANVRIDAAWDTDQIWIGSNGMGVPGVLSGIGGPVTVLGSGTTLVYVDDRANGSGTLGEMTATEVTGLTADPIDFTDLGKLTVSLGGQQDTFTVRDTIAGVTNLNTGAGDDIIHVFKTTGETTVGNDGGMDTVFVGEPDVPAPGVHVMNGIAGALHLKKAIGATFWLNLLDTGSTADKTVAITGNVATGLSPAAIDWAGVTNLLVALGTGANTVTLTSPDVTVLASVTTSATSSNVINVRSIDYATTLNLGLAGNVVNVGSNAVAANSTLDLINGELTINGNGFDQVNLFDNANAVAKTVTINAGDVTGATPVPIVFNTLNTLRLTLGSGADAVTVMDSTPFLTVNTGGGADTVNVRKTTRDVTVQLAGGADTARIGSLAPALGGVLSQINGVVTVVGDGGDTLVVDDSGSGTGKVGTLTSTQVGGLAPVAINYSGLANLDVRLGSGGDTLAVSSTAAGTSTVVATAAGADVVNVAAFNGVGGIVGPLTVTGSGNDTLNINDTRVISTANTGTLSATQFSFAGAVVNYTGQANLNVTLSPQTTFSVVSTAGATNTAIVANGGTVTVGGAAAGNLTAGVAGALSVDGNFVTDVVVNDSGDATGRNVTVTGTTVTGLSAGTIAYAEAKSLSVLTGTGGDTASVTGTHGQGTTVNTGGGADQVSVRANSGTLAVVTGSGADSVAIGSLAPVTAGGSFAGIGNAVTVTGGGVASLTVDASGDGSGPSVTLGKTTVTGLNSGGITYSGLSGLTLNLGAGNADVDVVSTSGGTTTTVNLGGGNDGVDVTAGDLNGALVLAGASGTDGLSVVDGSMAGGTVTVTPTTIGGLGATITYGGFELLNLALGASRSVAVNEIDPATATSVVVPSGQGTANFAGAFTGQLTLSQFSGGTVTVGGNLAGTLVTPGGIGSVSVGGSLTGVLSVGATLGTLTVGGALSGTVSVGGGLQAVDVGGDVSGALSVGGGVQTISIGGGLAVSGVLAVGGRLGLLSIDGAQAGSVTAGAVDVITVGRAAPASAGGAMFSVLESGVRRTIRGITSDGVGAAGVTAEIVYDSSGEGTPQAAIEIDNTNPGNRFDLVLEAPANSSGFDLTRVKTGDDRIVGVRNVNVAGNLLNKGITAAQAQYFGEPQNGVGGVYLPADPLAAVGVSGNMALFSVRSLSIQAVAFSTVTQKNGQVWSAGAISGEKKWQQDILLGTLAQNPKTKQPFAKIVRPTETLRLFAGTNKKKPAALFIGKDKAKTFVGRPAYFTDQRIEDGEPPVAVEATYAGKWSPIYPVITQLTFRGAGGSIDTIHVVKNITSTGPLGDVTLRGGKEQKLESLKAPSMFGKLTLLDGGTTSKGVKKAVVKAMGKASVKHK